MLSHRSLRLAALLVTAMGASALAGPGHNQPQPGATPPAAHKPGVAHFSYFAVVSANGALKRGSGAVTAEQPEGKGTYAVSFVSDVTNCAYVVTPGEFDSNGSLPAGGTTVVGRSGDPTAIFITTFDNTGAAKNMPIHVDIGC